MTCPASVLKLALGSLKVISSLSNKATIKCGQLTYLPVHRQLKWRVLFFRVGRRCGLIKRTATAQISYQAKLILALLLGTSSHPSTGFWWEDMSQEKGCDESPGLSLLRRCLATRLQEEQCKHPRCWWWHSPCNHFWWCCSYVSKSIWKCCLLIFFCCLHATCPSLNASAKDLKSHPIIFKASWKKNDA